MINAGYKWLKAFLVLEVNKLGSLVASIFGIYVNFLNEFLTVLLALPPSPPTISLLSALNVFGVDFLDDSVIFNIEISSVVILLKP